MIKIEKTEVVGWEAAIRGMRNPMNSWEKSDSGWCGETNYPYSKAFAQIGQYVSAGLADGIKNSAVNWDEFEKSDSGWCGAQKDGMMCECCLYFVSDECTNPHEGDDFCVGKRDFDLMLRLVHGGPVHAKFRRMIAVYADITAPLYWWKEYDTYKVGTVANSCSTMHKIADKEFTLDDFSTEHLLVKLSDSENGNYSNVHTLLQYIISTLNVARDLYLRTKDKQYWWHMIQLLPTSYNQKRTVMLNYEVLANIHRSRSGHKLDEWWDFCTWIESLPYSQIITSPSRTIKSPIGEGLLERRD